MADRPILFSAPMIKALIAGTKSQTRRLIKVEAERPIMEFVKVATDKDTGRAIYEMKDKAGQHVAIAAGKHFITEHYSPPIAVGDRLWVKETWKPHSIYADLKPSLIPESKVFFRADDGYAPSNTKWWLSLFMPRWASRISLLVEDVKVERLQDISNEDAIAEGVEAQGDANWPGYRDYLDDRVMNPSARGSYRTLWDSINGAGSWAANPWVVAYTFRVVLGNIDQIGGDA